MAGGWCYTKEIVMPWYGKFFEDLGCATLRFDYRRFGESSGEPRQHINPWDQIEDYRNALTFAETLPGIDRKRTGVWGISYSGGHALVVAALDSRPAFTISTIPVVDGFQTMRRCHGETRFAQLNRLLADDRRERFHGKPSGRMPMSPESPVSSNDQLTSWPRTSMRDSKPLRKRRRRATSTGIPSNRSNCCSSTRWRRSANASSRRRS